MWTLGGIHNIKNDKKLVNSTFKFKIIPKISIAIQLCVKKVLQRKVILYEKKTLIFDN